MPSAPVPKPPAPKASFLDDWLTKRKNPTPPTKPLPGQSKPAPSAPAVAPTPAPAGPTDISAIADAYTPPTSSNNQFTAPEPTPFTPLTPNLPQPSMPPTSPQSLPMSDPSKSASAGHLTSGDTIFIDRDGNLKQGD